ncbi:hypothetical protein Atai01_25890 [Amycolatopsis taiwanensis]|uniref:Uncharacterized protein n=1 Tax=Amycolatopsis taiwanensis TaxID=342230 RepID=A0A9W6R017_9PSEU|nr:hypothetical protein Atai01_25890 [Amycolatopsis taiwanensis]
MTGQDMQIRFARATRSARANPLSPSGWKNTELSRLRQFPRRCHSQVSATGVGSRDVSAMSSLTSATYGCGAGLPTFTSRYTCRLRQMAYRTQTERPPRATAKWDE